MKLSTYILATLIISTSSVLAQKMKWGEPTEVEIALKECPFDPEAIAVVTWESGDISLRMGNPVITEKHIRKKVLKSEGKEIADVILSYYAKDKFEQVMGVKAQTINIDSQGKKTITKLKSDEIVEVKRDENYNEIRFTFPDVKEGSILEYKYTTASKSYIFLEGWTFQNYIPTIKSEFKITIDNRFVYMYYLQGQEIYKKYKQMPSDNHWILENLPAITKEPFSGNRIDYIEKVRFQLVEYFSYETNSIEKYYSDWKKISENYYSHPKVYSYLVDKNKSNIVDEYINNNQLLEFKGSQDEIVNKIYNFINSHLTFDIDADYQSYPIQHINDLVKTAKGNKAEINLFFIYLCRIYNINANPIRISTKGNGKLLTEYALASQLDATFSHITFDNGQEAFLDPTDPQRPYGMLDPDCLVENSVIFLKNEDALIKPIKLNFKNGEEYSCFIDLKNITKPDIHMVYKASGYDALGFRKNPNKVKLWFEQNDNYILDSLSITDENIANKPVVANIKLKYVDDLIATEEIIFIEPFISKSLNENPFKNPKRTYPIDFGFTSNDTYRSWVLIPDGYIVDQIPSKMNLRTINGEVDFSYQVSIVGNNISFLARLNTNQNIVPTYSYESLRELLAQSINKMNEPLVLKRKSK